MPDAGSAFTEAREQRVLLFALLGGDAVHTIRILDDWDIAAEACPDVPTLCSGIAQGAGAVFLPEEALAPAVASRIVEILQRQPPWSDLPIIATTARRELARAGFGLARSLGAQANVSILERPVSVRAMVVSVQSALRARKRQYEARTLVAELAMARRRAEEGSRNKDEFLATLSHELRTPLNAMLGWTRMLRNGMVAPDRREHALDTVERNAVAQTLLIEELLDASRAAVGKLRVNVRPMDLAVAVRAAIDTVSPAAAAKHIDLHASFGPDSGPMHGDPERVEQVIWNLLHNAIKFTPVGGHVLVSVRRAEACVEIEVSDDGAGIPPDFLPHVFERFRQADSSVRRAQGGLGIGLALVKNIVDLHGGSVRASSKGVGRGATFVVVLPASSPSTCTCTSPSSRTRWCE